jgi:hypothetical protein
LKRIWKENREACFHLSVGKSSKYKTGYYVNPGFSIGLHKKDRAILEKIQSYFGDVGNIRKQGEESLQYRILSVKDLRVIIDHFDEYPLITQKRIDYELFKQALELVQNKEHLTIEGFQKIVNIRASMNRGLPDSLKAYFPNVIPSSIPLGIDSEIKDPNLLVGFVEAEWCFFVKITNNLDAQKKGATQVIVALQITQHSRDALLINSLVTFFDCGRVEPYYQGPAVNFVVSKLSDITEKIIPFFEAYPLIGTKAKNFEDFKKIASLMESKAHLTKEGLEEIRMIKSGMNSLRIVTGWEKSQ